MINEKQAKRFCKEEISKIKNYALAIADTTQTWHCHHMTETWWNCSAKDLIKNECYYNRKACELIFLTPSEHHRLHMKGKNHSNETRRKLSESLKGHTVTEEARRKMSEAKKGKHHSDETRRKMSESRKGENNHNFGKHASDETRRKMSAAHKGRTSPVKNMTWKLIDGKRVWLPKEVK